MLFNSEAEWHIYALTIYAIIGSHNGILLIRPLPLDVSEILI